MHSFHWKRRRDMRALVSRQLVEGHLFIVPFRHGSMNLAPERGRDYLRFRVFLNNPRPASPDASSANEAGSGVPDTWFGT
jgi:hypothetical protein